MLPEHRPSVVAMHATAPFPSRRRKWYRASLGLPLEAGGDLLTPAFLEPAAASAAAVVGVVILMK